MSDGWTLEWMQAGTLRRVAVNRELKIGTSPDSDIRLSDPYVSRIHCVITASSVGVTIKDLGSRNGVYIEGVKHPSAKLSNGHVFLVGQTSFRVAAAEADDPQTLTLHTSSRGTWRFRESTRELLDPMNQPSVRFSQQEARALAELARAFPDAASHQRLGAAIWAGMGYDDYQLHRLMQRIRNRLKDIDDLVENVRGTGYRLCQRVDLV